MPGWDQFKTSAMPTSGGGNPILSPALYDSFVSGVAAWPDKVNASGKGLYALGALQVQPAPLPAGLTGADAGVMALDQSDLALKLWNGSGWITLANLGSALPAQTGNAGKFLRTNGSAMSWQAVDKLQDRDVASTAPASGQALLWNATNSRWEPGSPSSSPTGGAGGSLTGTYPNPGIAASGVAAGTYGTANAVPRIAVGSDGRVTSVNEIALTAAVANYSAPVTAASSVTVLGTAHGFGTNRLIVECYDNSTPAERVSPSRVAVHPTTFDVTVEFGQTFTGRVIVNGVGGSGPSAGTPNYSQAFTSQTSVSISAATHGFASPALAVVVYDTSSPREMISPKRVAVDASTLAVTVEFEVATSGTIVINGTGGSAAGGDAAAIRGLTVTTTAPTDKQVLTWDAAGTLLRWASAFPSQTGLAGKILATDGSTTSWSDVTQLAGRPLATTAPADGQTLAWSATNNRWQPGAAASTGSRLVLTSCQIVSQTTSGAVQQNNGGAQTRTIADLDSATLGRLTVNVTSLPGAAGQTLEIWYSSDGSTWSTTGVTVTLGTSGFKDSGWVSLASGARIANCHLRLQTSGGNGTVLFVDSFHFHIK